MLKQRESVFYLNEECLKETRLLSIKGFKKEKDQIMFGQLLGGKPADSSSIDLIPLPEDQRVPVSQTHLPAIMDTVRLCSFLHLIDSQNLKASWRCFISATF